MQSFVPPKKSMFEKFLQNGTLIFFVGLVLLFSATFYYFKSNKVKTALPHSPRKTVFIATPRSFTESNSEQASKESTDSLEKEVVKEEFRSNAVDKATDSASKTVEKNLNHQDLNKNNKSIEQQESVSGALTPLKVIIQYAEVTSKGFYTLVDEAKQSGQFASSDYSQGAINSGEQKIKNLAPDITIYAKDNKQIANYLNASWFNGLKSSNESNDIGLSTELIIKSASEGHIIADLKISKKFQVNLSEPNSKSFQSIDYLGSIDLQRDQVYFITNVLTTLPMIAQQEYLTSISPFEILKSINFKTGETISVFFYHFEK
ncbi:MAG: hypothetical protein KDD45_15870 [Bdellovibrionales bacterium]|nr:hypothetical protein [Bdellovibrionales bacterium]